MNLRGEKLNTVDRLRMMTSMGASITQDINSAKESADRFTGKFNSLKSDSNDTVEFLIDLMLIVLGTVFLEKTMNKVMNNILRKESEGGKIDLESVIKTEFLKALKLKDDSKVFPDQFLQGGYVFPIKLLDLFDLFMTNPNTAEGALLYGADTSNFAHQFMNKVVQTGTVANLNTITPDINYHFSPVGGSVTIKGTMLPSERVNAYFERMVMSPDFKFIDRKKLVVDILDAVISTLAKHKSKRALKAEEMIETMVSETDPEGNASEYSVFTPEWFEAAQERVETRKNGGYVVDLSCSVSGFVFDAAELDQIASDLDVNAALDAAMGAKLAAEGVEYAAPIKENLKRNMIKAIVGAILRNTLFAPQLWIMVLLSHAFKHGYTQDKYTKYVISATGDLNIAAILKDNNQITGEITRLLKRLLIKELSNIVLKEIVKLVLPIQVEVYKEQMEQYSGITKSLTGGIGGKLFG